MSDCENREEKRSRGGVRSRSGRKKEIGTFFTRRDNKTRLTVLSILCRLVLTGNVLPGTLGGSS